MSPHGYTDSEWARMKIQSVGEIGKKTEVILPPVSEVPVKEEVPIVEKPQIPLKEVKNKIKIKPKNKKRS